ncbi:MAG: hypothetical protein MMC23_008481 [Stictis urceolatum]|nr:hypothetical protein [Stictis urceolata]
MAGTPVTLKEIEHWTEGALMGNRSQEMINNNFHPKIKMVTAYAFIRPLYKLVPPYLTGNARVKWRKNNTHTKQDSRRKAGDVNIGMAGSNSGRDIVGGVAWATTGSA